ncbi:MAG: photosynthetic reaction center subunit H [Labrys sp. (in: a-proteobacteria)]
MQTGAITGYIDVAQVVLYAFWVFFAGLIFYIRQEDRREGYPLENDKTGKVGPRSWLFVPDPKTFVLPHGHGTFSAPNDKRDRRPLKAEKIGTFPGAPYEPTGNPMLAEVGPGSYAERSDTPDLTIEGHPKIVPMRVSHGYHVDPTDPNPIGMPVIGCDRHRAGTVTDVWVDQSEHTIRFLEVDVPKVGRRLLPINFCTVNRRPDNVYTDAIAAAHFADVPTTKSSEQITLLEEEKVMAYFGAGTLYAHPSRSEPIL